MASAAFNALLLGACCLLAVPTAIDAQSPPVDTQLFVSPTFAGGQVTPSSRLD